MTEEQLKTLRAECRAVAFESAAVLLYRTLEQYRPDVLPQLRESAMQATEKYQGMTFSDRSAEYSDLTAAEFRDAFEAMLATVFRVPA